MSVQDSEAFSLSMQSRTSCLRLCSSLCALPASADGYVDACLVPIAPSAEGCARPELGLAEPLSLQAGA